MDWNGLATSLWDAWRPHTIDEVRSVLIRVDADWSALELLTCPEVTHSVVSLDATSFDFEVRSTVPLTAWLDQLDALSAREPRWLANGWVLRFATAGETEAAQASLDQLISGLRVVALGIAARLQAAKSPIVVLTGLARDVGVVTVSSPTPGLVLPVTVSRAPAYVSLLANGKAELFTEGSRQALENVAGLAAGSRHAEDHELWEVPERREGLELVERHLAGTPATLPSPRQAPPEPRPPDPPVREEVVAALERALAPEVSGADAEELFQPGIGGLSVAVLPWGLRLFFSAPKGVLGVLFGRPLARLELRAEDLALDLASPTVRRELVHALPRLRCLRRHLAKKVFVSERTDGPIFDVDAVTPDP